MKLWIKVLSICVVILCAGFMIWMYMPLRTPELKESHIKKFKLKDNQLPIFYSPHYNISFWGLERLHPFDSKKYGRIFKILKDWKSIDPKMIVRPKPPAKDILLKVHTENYLKRLRSAKKLAEITELGAVSMLPWRLTRKRMLIPMLYATGGSILAGKAALNRGWAINLGGGFHHAFASDGGGFCVYADVSLSIKWLLQTETSVKRVMIIDLDAHQGNGHERDFSKNQNVFIMDMYNSHIYPNDEVAKKGIDLKVELSMLMEDEEYLFLLKNALSKAFEAFSPDIIYYVAGTDSLKGDPLGLLSLSPQGIIKRDEMVFKAALKRKIPIVMLLAGGYQRSGAPAIAQSIQNLLSFLK